MIQENFAERLYCDLKNAGVNIHAPKYQVEGSKSSDVPNSKQFTIFGIKQDNGSYLYNFKYGPSISDTYKASKTFTEAYSEFLDEIKKLGIDIKFYSLFIPTKIVNEAKLEDWAKAVVSRCLKDYIVETDTLIVRWDVLVAPV